FPPLAERPPPGILLPRLFRARFERFILRARCRTRAGRKPWVVPRVGGSVSWLESWQCRPLFVSEPPMPTEVVEVHASPTFAIRRSLHHISIRFLEPWVTP